MNVIYLMNGRGRSIDDSINIDYSGTELYNLYISAYII